MDARQRFLSYWLIDELGGDRLGPVYRAEDARSGRTVVLRIMRVGDVVARDREGAVRDALRHRIRAALAVVHDSLAAVLDFTADEDADVLISEDVDGPSIEDLERAGRRLPPDQALWHATELADGLAVAHAHGVLHGRVSPRNVRLAPDGRARLLDLGVPHASLVVGSDFETPDLTHKPALMQRDVESLGRIVQYMVKGDVLSRARHSRAHIDGLAGAVLEATGGVLGQTNPTAADLHAALRDVARHTPIPRGYAVTGGRTPKRPVRGAPPTSSGTAAPPADRPATPTEDPGKRLVPDRVRLPSAHMATSSDPEEQVQGRPSEASSGAAPVSGPRMPAAGRPSDVLGDPRNARHAVLVPPAAAHRKRLMFDEDESPAGVILPTERRSRTRERRTATLWRNLRRHIQSRVPGAPSAAQFAVSATAGAALVLIVMAVLAPGPEPTRGAAASERTPVESAPAVPVGDLRVSVDPSNARVSLNGGPWRPAPVTFIDLPVAVYEIRVVAPGHRQNTDSVRVTAGEPTRREYRLDPGN